MEGFFSLLQSESTLFVAATGFLGLLLGSFLNVVIFRLPKMMEYDWQCQCADLRGEPIPENKPLSLIRPRSCCPQCGQRIRALENIPLVSYLVLGGKCSACKTSIPLRYPIVEATSGILAATVALSLGPTWATLGALLLTWALIALTVIDFDTKYLPDVITLPLLWCGLLFNLGNVFTDLPSAVIGAMAGYLALWSVYWLFKLITGKEGMGYGDFKLLGAIGAWLGWQQLPLVILLSSFVGAIVGIALIVLARGGRDIPIPFGPYLAAAGFIALLWGQDLMRLYLNFI